jgi:hypothetical protein
VPRKREVSRKLFKLSLVAGVSHEGIQDSGGVDCIISGLLMSVH